MFHSSIIHGSQTMATTQMFTNWRMDKQNVVYPYNGLPFDYKKEVLIHARTWMNPKNIVLMQEVRHKRQYIVMTRIGKSIETESRLVVAKG